MWMTAFRITGRCSPRAAAGGPDPMVPASRLRVVEVDHEADAAARHPHADPHPVVRRVHEVHVVAAVVRALVLEEEVRAQHGAVRVPAATTEVLGPAIAVVAR